ncbi:hypothetical protein [uncultured Kocuria sp.]|uniref:hypothetical protein n=1 Tax=uncultured Kocuria sp. TaxID=259305 RepID=UPI002623E7B9|nr:hypothetical protein [uncultured Kocuria sp.]
MKFNVQRVLTPAYLTSIALVVVGVVLGLAWYPVAAWLFVLAGLALNAMAVSVTEIDDTPRAPGTTGRRRPSLPSRRTGADDHGGEHEGQAPPARPERVEDRTADEPEAETQATPVVPSAGSSPVKPRR